MPTHGLKMPTHGLKMPTHGLKMPTREFGFSRRRTTQSRAQISPGLNFLNISQNLAKFQFCRSESILDFLFLANPVLKTYQPEHTKSETHALPTSSFRKIRPKSQT